MAIQVIVQCMFFLPYPKTKQFKEIILFFFILSEMIKLIKSIKILRLMTKLEGVKSSANTFFCRKSKHTWGDSMLGPSNVNPNETLIFNMGKLEKWRH